MIRRIASAVTWLSVLAVIVVAGGHTIYYLLNWEWVRADLAATVFVAGLVVGSALQVLGRLQRIDRRLDQLVERQAQQAIEQSRQQPMEPAPDFPWLADPASSTTLPAVVPLLVPVLLLVSDPPRESVFIPVFLAAGLLVAVLASGVERLAVLWRGAVPAASPGTSGPRPQAESLVRPLSPRALVAVPVLGVLGIGAVVGGLYLASHYWSRPIGAGTTTMAVEVERDGPTRPDEEVVETVARYCTLNTGTGVHFEDVSRAVDGSVTLRLSPLLDDDAQNRFIGCLEDAVVEWHRLSVTSTALTPSD